MATIVTTKEQLKQAVKNKTKEIIIEDEELAKNIVKFKKNQKAIEMDVGSSARWHRRWSNRACLGTGQ